MAVQQIIDITDDLNTGSSATLDIGGWDFVVVHLVTPTGPVNFLTSNDGGGVSGVSDGNAVSATNFVAVTGTVLATGASATLLSASGLIKFSGIGQFLRISGTAIAVTKAFIRYYKSF